MPGYSAAVPGPPVAGPWLRVSQDDRDRVVALLQDAYAEGRLDHEEFDARLGRALAARTFGDLDATLSGLVQPLRPAAPPRRPVPLRASGSERAAAAFTHWSAYLTFILGPAIVACAESGRPTYLREQAIDAVNFHLTFILANIVFGATAFLILPGLLLPVIWVAWFVLVFVGGVSAATGAPFHYPLTLRILR